jgi:hypothetical protein
MQNLADLFRGDHWHGLGGQGNRIRAAHESQPRHPHIAIQSDPGVRRAEMGCEFPIDFERAPIELFPLFEGGEKLFALFDANRTACASACCVDRHLSRLIEVKSMTTRDMKQPMVCRDGTTRRTLLVFEIGRLELKRRNHWRNVEVMRRSQQCRVDVAISHDGFPFQIQGFPLVGSGKRASGLNGETFVLPRHCQRQARRRGLPRLEAGLRSMRAALLGTPARMTLQ